MAYTLNQLCARASALTSLTDLVGSDERTLMDQWANEGIFKVFQDTQCVVTAVNVNLTANVDEYALDRGVLTVLNYAQISTNPTSRIAPMSAGEILERRFLASSGSAVQYFAVLGGNLLIVSPKPTTAAVIQFYCVPVPDVVTATQDIFITGLPTYGQRAVEAYLNARCYEHNRDYQNTQYWDAQYDKECGKIKIADRRQAGRTMAPNRIGYPRSLRSPSRNDTYPNDY